MHFYFDHAVALTGLAAPAFDVEAEAPRFIAPCTRFRDCCEDLADGRKQAGVGGGVGTRCTADRALIDLDDTVDEIQALDAVEVRGARRGRVELGGDRAK